MMDASHEMERWSDVEVCTYVADRIARPKIAEADSFVLHAPLELLARAALLRRVSPRDRDRARRRIAWLGARYEAAGPAIEPSPSHDFPDARAAGVWIASAIDAGDLEGADSGAVWLATHATPLEIAQALVDDLLPRLGAAGHACIFLDQLLRVAPRSPSFAQTLRPLVRELAREGTWKLGWHLQRPRGIRPSTELVDRLLRPRSPGDPGSPFIIPTMSIVERSGLASEVLADATVALRVDEARTVLGRLASWSMLQDDASSAPYGWTHCLTMPQATLGVAPLAAHPDHAVAIAATWVLGFRSTLGRTTLDPTWTPKRPPSGTGLDALDGSPDEAASAVWHAPDRALPRLGEHLATRAAIHPDAHLAKFTLACFDAAADDVAASRLHLAAAAYLGAWWRAQPLEDPIGAE